MNFFRAILLLVALSVGQPTVQRYKVDNFTASDSLSVLLVRGPISGVPYRPLRVTAAGNSFELGAVTGTGPAVNANGPTVSNLTATGTLDFSLARALGGETWTDYASGTLVALAGSGSASPSLSMLSRSEAAPDFGPIIRIHRTRGTSSPLDGDRIGAIFFYGADNTATAVTQLNVVQDGDYDQLTNRSMKFVFRGTNETSASNWMTIRRGNLLLGSETDNGQRLQVTGTSRFTGAATFQSTLAVTGASTFTGLVSGVSSHWSGRVGIGTTSPSEKLEVRQSSASGGASILIVNEAPAGTQGETAEIKFATANNVAAISKISATRTGSYSSESNRNSDLRFWTSASGATTERMRITHGGNVLVNTNTNLGYELQVNGTTYATRFQSGTGTSVMDTLKPDVLSVSGTATFAGVNMVGSNNSADYLFSSVARTQTLAVGGPEQGLVPVLTSNNTTLELDGNLEITGGVTSSTVNVTSLTAGGSTVNGTATFNGNINATAPASFSSIDVGSLEASSVDVGGGSMTLTGNGGSLFFVNSGATHTRFFPGTSVDYSGTIETGSIVSKGTISATGNLAVAGGTFSGNVSIGTNKFTVNAATGNTTVAGKLTLNGGLEVPGGLEVNPLYLSEDGGGYSLEYYGSRVMHKADGVEAMAVYDDSVEVHGILRVGGVAQMSGGVNTSTLRSPAGPISVHIAGSGTPQHVLAATYAEFPATVRVKAPSGGSGTLWVQANNGATSADSWAITSVGGGTQSLQIYAATYGGNQNFIRLDASNGNVVLQKSTVMSSGNNLTLQQGNVIVTDGTIQVQTFTGGTAYACWDPFGNLFRSTSPCL